MSTQYVTASLTYWDVDDSLYNSINSSYFSRIHIDSEIFIANYANVSFVDQLTLKPIPELEDNLFAIKLKVIEKKLTDREEIGIEKICDILYELGFYNKAREIESLAKETVEVYAVSVSNSEFLGKFDVAGDNAESIADMLCDIEGVKDILSIKGDNTNV